MSILKKFPKLQRKIRGLQHTNLLESFPWNY